MSGASFALWLVLGVAAVPYWGAILWIVWEEVIRPRLIPRAELDGLVTTLIAEYGDRAEEIASVQQSNAWFRSDGFEQGKWRLIRRRINAYRREMQ